MMSTKMDSVPFFTKQSFRESESKQSVSGAWFFELFALKRLKLILAIIAGIVGTIGNYYAVRFQLESTRFDMGHGEILDLYAFGLTAFLELMIIVFHLMRIHLLIVLSTTSALIISIYANLILLWETNGIGAYQMFLSLTLAILPIIILTYLMRLTVEQFDEELNELRRNNNGNV